MKEKFFEEKRKQLIEEMKKSGALHSKEVEKAFLNVKREIFVLPSMEKATYEDTALSIGFNQTISQPSTISIMLEMLNANQEQKVLEVGSGCGYVLALLSEIIGDRGRVFGIEAVKELFTISGKNLKKHGCENTMVVCGDGSLGLKEFAPFDRIIVSAACPFMPKSLFDQLKEGGKVVAPVGDKYTQVLQAMAKKNGKPLKEDHLGSYFVFVPLLGKEGFK